MKYYVDILNEKGTIAVDDTILVKGASSQAGCRILEGFKPLFSAEAVVRLEEKGYTVSGKTAVGEFGLDLVGELAYDKEAAPCAAASLVASGEIEGALGVDMNGSTRRAAAASGVDFLRPTYGTVSRYGVISCASSGEQIGVYARTADKVAELMSVIAGHDEKDGTSLREVSYEYSTDLDVKGKRVALVKELYERADGEVKAKLDAYADALRSAGAEVEEVSLDIFDTANTAWQIIMCAETCNNVSRYDGVKYGHRAAEYKNIDELYVNSRTEGFNFLAKAVILYGSDVLSKNRYKDCFDKSLRVRRVIADKLKAFFADYDAILSPATSASAYESYEEKDAFVKVFEESVYTAAASLVGIPALVSGGVQLMGAHFSESVLLSLAKSVERKGE